MEDDTTERIQCASAMPSAPRNRTHKTGQKGVRKIQCCFWWWGAQSCPTLWDTMDCSPPGSSVHGDSPGKNAGVGCHALFQGIFPTQGSRPGLLYCRQILYHLRHQENPKAVCIHIHFLLLEWPPGALRLSESHFFLLREQVSRSALLDEWWRKESKKVRKAVYLCC